MTGCPPTEKIWHPPRLCPMCFVMMGKTVVEVANHFLSWHKLTFSASVLAQGMFKDPLACEDVLKILKDINQGRKKVKWFKKDRNKKDKKIEQLVEKSRRLLKQNKARKVKQMKKKSKTIVDAECTEVLSKGKPESIQAVENMIPDRVSEEFEIAKINHLLLERIDESTQITEPIDLDMSIELHRQEDNDNEMSKQQKEIDWLKTQLKEAKVILNDVLNQKYQNCLDRLVLANQNNCELRKEINRLITDKIELIEAAEKAEQRECSLKEYIVRIKAYVFESNSKQSLSYMKLITTVKKNLSDTKTTLTNITRRYSSNDKVVPNDVCANNNSFRSSEEEYAECITVKQEPTEMVDEQIVLIKQEPDVSLNCPMDMTLNWDMVSNPHSEDEGVTNQLIGKSFTHYNLLMIKLKSGCRYVTILHREMKDLNENLSRLSLLPPDWMGRQKILSWITILSDMQESDELDESQARQLSFDLNLSYDDFNSMVQFN